MRRLIVGTGLLLLASGSFALAAKQDFTLINRTGYQIDYVYVSPHSSSHWGDDIMGRDALADGDHVDVSFNDDARSCHYDLRVKYNDGDTAEWNDINLCEVSKVTLRWDRKNQVTRATTE